MHETLRVPYDRQVYRCFNSVTPSQHLFDDIGLTDEEQEALASEVDSSRPHERISRRGLELEALLRQIDAKFTAGNWFADRFCDGSWPVLYAAESEDTCVQEKLYHAQKFYREESRRQPVSIDLAIAFLQATTKQMFDLSKSQSLDGALLISYDDDGYPYCQQVAAQCIADGAEALRSRSARDATGTCVAIFSPGVISGDKGIRKWLKCIIEAETCEVYSRDSKYSRSRS